MTFVLKSADVAILVDMHIYGLTGGIASGKSAVSSLLESLGYPIIDADILARKGRLVIELVGFNRFFSGSG